VAISPSVPVQMCFHTAWTQGGPPTTGTSLAMSPSRTILIFALMCLVSIGVTAQSLTCGVDRNESLVFPMAPEGANRITDEHALVVNYKLGAKRFVDKPPYDEELSGLHWHYCGYIPAVKAHLVEMDQDDLFSGKLLLNDTGLLLDAGHTVYPSPDGRLFLAIRQEDGMDGELWLVSDLSGRKLWSGYAGTMVMVKLPGSTGAPYEGVESTYEDPHWSAQGVLQARVVCHNSRGTKGTVTLTQAANSWRWQSDIQCKD
jgi:hypothetical protein